MAKAALGAAVRLCPHIAIRRHTRAPQRRLDPDTVTPAGWSEDKPDQWVLEITRDYRYQIVRGVLIFPGGRARSPRRLPQLPIPSPAPATVTVS